VISLRKLLLAAIAATSAMLAFASVVAAGPTGPCC
jgi:hypothetical protein